MYLRKLEAKDAPYILEWMHDSNVNCFFRFDPNSITIKTVQGFIKKAQDDTQDMHLACVDDSDEYLGTISLKNIDTLNKSAEYAVSFRSCAQGKGAASFATKKIIKIAFEQLGLIRVYLNVLEENRHACEFYEHMGFTCEGVARCAVIIKEQPKNLKWYAIIKE